VGSSATTESRNNVSLRVPVEAHTLAKEAIHQSISRNRSQFNWHDSPLQVHHASACDSIKSRSQAKYSCSCTLPTEDEDATKDDNATEHGKANKRQETRIQATVLQSSP